MSAKKELHSLRNKEIAAHSSRFFKSGKGEYGEGDKFLGVRMPQIRAIAKKYWNIEFDEVSKLIMSSWHEERMLGLIIVVYHYEKVKKSDEKQANKLYKYYCSQFKYINNWDLVDVTCYKIIGEHLLDKDRKILFKWAKSKDLWIKRISMMSTFAFIRKNEFDETMKIANILLKDEHDLIHKVVGWMLREVAKRDKPLIDEFLKKNQKVMARTMLRYAIEKYPQAQRKKILAGTF